MWVVTLEVNQRPYAFPYTVYVHRFILHKLALEKVLQILIYVYEEHMLVLVRNVEWNI